MAQGRVRWIVHIPGHGMDIQYRPLGDGHEDVTIDHDVQADNAADGLGSSGWDASRPYATLAAFSRAHKTTVRLSAASRASDSLPRQGLSLVNRMTHPREWRSNASVRSMGHPTPITDIIEAGPEPLDLRRFRCS